MPIEPLLRAGCRSTACCSPGPAAWSRGRYGRGLTGRRCRGASSTCADRARRRARARISRTASPGRRAASIDGAGVVTGVPLRRPAATRTHRARMVIAADGRGSRLAAGSASPVIRRGRAAGRLAATSRRRRAAHAGEMHVRRGHYIGVAPMPGGLANACLVPPEGRSPAWPIRPRCCGGRFAATPRWRRASRTGARAPPQVLGPMAWTCRRQACPDAARGRRGRLHRSDDRRRAAACARGAELAAAVAARRAGNGRPLTRPLRVTRLTALRLVATGGVHSASGASIRSLRALVSSPSPVVQRRSGRRRAPVAPSAFEGHHQVRRRLCPPRTRTTTGRVEPPPPPAVLLPD